MNLLAHAYLSFNDPGILTGNMISDYVKGKKKLLYPAIVQKGITLHRAIDAFTDDHPATKEAKEFFRGSYRLYAGAFVDVVYDHFLANDPLEFEDGKALQLFAASTYQGLEQNKPHLPEQFAAMLPYMQAHNWLYNYRFKFGIERSFEGLVRRSTYLTDSAPAFSIFEEHYQSLGECYRHFFPYVKKMAVDWLQNYTSGINEP